MQNINSSNKIDLRLISTLVEKAVTKCNKIPRKQLTRGHVEAIAFEIGISSEHVITVGDFFESETRQKNKKHGLRYAHLN